MNKNKILLALSAAFCVGTLHSESTPMPSLAPVLKAAMPAVVNVAVQGVIPGNPRSDPRPLNNEPGDEDDNKPRKFQSIGSGVILDPSKGLIVTNNHVIRDANLITVTLNDGRHLEAKLIGGDADTDVAVLKVDAGNLRSLVVGDSDKAEVGDYVIAVGNPFGLNSLGNSQTATFGIISATKRSDLNIEGLENFIQTDAAINPGNSGGALLNTKGELIGINTAILSPYGGNVGIGFAIPINMVKDVAQQLLQYGSIHRGMMGIFVQHLTPELAQAMGYPADQQGGLVAQVNEGSPAEKAGLKPGDIITHINGSAITQATQVKITISMLRVGSTVQLHILRDGKAMDLQATVTDAKQNEESLQASNHHLYGLAIKNTDLNSPLHGHILGVQISGAAETSPAWRAGLRPGDIIISANKKPTPDVDTLQKIASTEKGNLLVQVIRGPGALFILII